MLNHLLILTLAVFFGNCRLAALSTRYFLRPLIWSADGKFLFLENRELGPEGGKTRGYLLLGPPAFQPQLFITHCTLGSGNGPSAEKISFLNFQIELYKIKKCLDKYNFSGVKIKNNFPSRKLRLEIATGLLGDPTLGRWTGRLPDYRQGQLRLKINPGEILFFSEEKLLASWPDSFAEYMPDAFLIYQSPLEPLLILLAICQDNVFCHGLISASNSAWHNPLWHKICL